MLSDSADARKRWRVKEADEGLVSSLCGALDLSPVICMLLAERGVGSADEARRFLNPDLDAMSDPFLLDGMEAAVGRTMEAIEGGAKILVHGDYDADGITSAALVVRVLRVLKADVEWRVPHRQRDGYGMSVSAVEDAKEAGVSLIITTDCGVSEIEAVERASELGIDVIVTDHHEVSGGAADALAVIDPKKPGCPYPFKELAGVGVAFKFAEALVGRMGFDAAGFRRRFCDLAAIGTVADIAPLLGENRALVSAGLLEIPRSGKKGIGALLRASGMDGRGITSYTLAYGIAPRLNAAGRLDDASVALELLLETDEKRAAEFARALDDRNRERQSQQERMLAEAVDKIAAMGIDDSTKVLVLSSKGWHPGVVGIVAGKVCERFSRPSIVIAMDDSGETGVGSARSIESFDIMGALSRCSEYLDRFGGHSGAAGLSIAAEKLPVFCDEMNRIAGEHISGDDMLPVIDVDAELELSSVNLGFAEELDVLQPFGFGNPEPVFMTRGAVVKSKKVMGSSGTHLKVFFTDESGGEAECVAFGWGGREGEFEIGSAVDVCYNIRVNEFNGRRTAQMVLKDCRASNI